MSLEKTMTCKQVNKKDDFRPECMPCDTELCRVFNTNLSNGLKSAEIESTIRPLYGYNELEKGEGKSVWQLLLEQFDDTLVKILLAAAAVSFLLAAVEETEGNHVSAYVEPLVILIILVLNALVGVWQESNAEAALEALKDLQPENARVLRDGKMSTIPSRELVPGDIVEIRVGDKVPADLRLFFLKTTSMRLEQAQLTGESVSVDKDIDDLPTSTERVIQAKVNMLFASTVVVSGMGRAIVVQTGMDTEIGQIQKSVQEAAEEEEATPLKKKLDEFGDLLSKVILVICVVVWAINYKNFFDPSHGSVFKGCIYYFKIAVALAVAAIPEGLPAVITTCLALGTRKMAKKNAIVRKLPSVETLGCTSVICSDKTGTLTTNEMSCITFSHASTSDKDVMTSYDVEGVSYAPTGQIYGMPPLDESDKTLHLKYVAAICTLCNESTIEYNLENEKYTRVGEPTEAALKVLVEKMALPAENQEKIEKIREADRVNTASYCANYWKKQYNVVATLEFNRNRKSMSVLCNSTKSGKKSEKNDNMLMVKGAPEGILSRCSKIILSSGKVVKLTSKGRESIETRIEQMASTALRCLALAFKDDLSKDLATYDGHSKSHAGHKLLSNMANFEKIESDLTFVGLVGMLDPPRPEIEPMIKVCTTAGIRVIMITGDNKLTAEAIATKVGILEKGSDLTHKSFTGNAFFALSDKKQSELLCESHGGLVFSRTEPRHKQLLVRMLKQQGEVVAMTGDGVNDAPALKQADIGIAMGITGTEVAKEAADMILADDNFATIVSAVEEGRAIYDNMQAFIRYLISSNIGEVAAIFFTAALGLPEGLIPVQLLWVNLVTDGPPATALGFNPADADIMKKLPRKANDVLINGWVFFRYMVIGIYVGLACVGVFAYWYMFYDGSDDGHTLISFYELTHWSECPTWTDFKVADFDGMTFSDDPCSYFTTGKVSASTLSLSVLVTIEMLNALNALSEDGSLFHMPPWANPYLLLAMVVSFGMHFLILYVDWMADIFSVTPLDFNEWMVVLAFSFPVIVIDEVLKFVGRQMSSRELSNRLLTNKKHQ